jgi:hypothetical protein
MKEPSLTSSTATYAGGTDIWIAGEILTVHSAKGERIAKDASKEQKKLLSRDQNKNQETTGTIQPGDGSSLISMVTLRQRPSANLPKAMRLPPKPEAVAAIPTLAEKTSTGVRLTLYLDSLFSESDLRSAQVQKIVPDSLIIQLSSLRFSYKLPEGWLPR